MNEETMSELAAAFQDVARTMSGILSVYDADDNLMWAVARGLGQVFEHYLEIPNDDRAAAPVKPRDRRPHPAMVELLRTAARHAEGRKEPAR